MDEREAKRCFDEARQYYMQKDYADALVLFDKLDRHFPDNRRILVNRARCLARLGRNGEALDLCEHLIAEFSDAQALTLRDKLEARRGAVDTPPIDFPKAAVLDTPAFRPAPLAGPAYRARPPAPAAPALWRRLVVYAGIAFASAVALLLLSALSLVIMD
jgi:tetratricopeptide (TPR) repeat protein